MWCTQWKGTPQDCVDHIRQKHSVPSSAKVANLGRWFPPWTVTRAVWHNALKPHVSGVSTDVLLFSESGSSLVHHYRVFGRSAAHTSLHGKYMAKLRSFTIRAAAEARRESDRLPTRKNQLPAVSDTLRSIRPQDDKDFVPSLIQSVLVATQPYPSSPESHTFTVYVDLDPFPSEGSGSSDGDVLGLPVEQDRMSVSSVNSGDDDQTDVAIEVSRFRPMNHPDTPVNISSDSQLVVEFPSHYEAPAVPVTISALMESVVQLSHISALSSVQLSPNRVREDYIYETVDVSPMFQVSRDTAEYLPATSPVTPLDSGSLPTSPIPPDPDPLPPGATGSFDSLLGCQGLIEQAPDLSRLSTCPGRGLLTLYVCCVTLEITR